GTFISGRSRSPRVAEGRRNGLRMLWEWFDGSLRSLSDSLRSILRTLRVVRVLLVVGILAVLASAVVGLLWPRWFSIAYAVASVVLVIPLIALLALVVLPLRAKSVVRLIDKGYPGNARELAIRVAARKMRDQSIETEELLVETAVNESRKVVDRYRERARRLKEQLDAMEPAGGTAGETQRKP
ncbi:MAG TPA: hypothetical protein VGB18_07460, partial [Candidatus Thermoplasmatota archaeon]